MMFVSRWFLVALSSTITNVFAGNQAADRASQHLPNYERQTTSNSSPLQVDLGYSIYQGTLNPMTNVRTWLGYVFTDFHLHHC